MTQIRICFFSCFISCFISVILRRNYSICSLFGINNIFSLLAGIFIFVIIITLPFKIILQISLDVFSHLLVLFSATHAFAFFNRSLIKTGIGFFGFFSVFILGTFNRKSRNVHVFFFFGLLTLCKNRSINLYFNFFSVCINHLQVTFVVFHDERWLWCTHI